MPLFATESRCSRSPRSPCPSHPLTPAGWGSPILSSWCHEQALPYLGLGFLTSQGYSKGATFLEASSEKDEGGRGRRDCCQPLALCLSLSPWEMGRSGAGVRGLSWAGGKRKEDGGYRVQRRRTATSSAGLSPHPLRTLLGGSQQGPRR